MTPTRERAQRIVSWRHRGEWWLEIDELEREINDAISEAVLAFADQLFGKGPYRSTVLASARKWLREREGA